MHGKRGCGRWKSASLLGAAALLFLCCAPVGVFRAEGPNGILLQHVVPIGAMIETRYIHSVERTPVIDIYVIVSGNLWQWEERTKSHNAGLPTMPGRQMRFFEHDGWMVFRGGRHTFPTIAWRIGNGHLGRNVLAQQGEREWEAFRDVPGERVFLSATEMPLLAALVVECDRTNRR